MIESEEKKKRISDLLERWVKHTKLEKYLRDYDVPSLVSRILSEFYHIQLCCGHLVDDLDDCTSLEIDDGDGVIYGCYCKDCAKSMLKNDNVKICNRYAAEAHDG